MMTPFVGCLLLLVACGGLVPSAQAVRELDDHSFYEYAKGKDVLLVDFYAPWCSDCKALEPDFEAAANKLGARSVDLAKVDCFGAGKSLCSKYGVKQWPTLKNFNKGKYTGDYTGGLTSAEIAGYVNTVENSAAPQASPYAAPFSPAALATQQCVTRCKISKITNKAPCYARCKAPKPAAGRKMLPQPVINEKSCAKCRQPQIAGKFSRHCSLSVRKACTRRHKARRGRARAHKADVTSKKATIGTLTSAENDNVVKMTMGEALIVPPNAEHRRPRNNDLVAREPKFPRKGTAFDEGPTATNDDSEHQRTLKLLDEAQDKNQPVLNIPKDKYIHIPPHDSGDKKTKLKAEKQIKYPLPKVPAKPFQPQKHLKPIAPKFVSVKVPPHDAGDLTHAAPPNKAAAFHGPRKPGFVPINRNVQNKLSFAKRIKPGPVLNAKLPTKLHQPLTIGKVERKNLHLAPASIVKQPIGPDAAPLLKKQMAKISQPPMLIRTNGTGLLFGSPLVQGPKQEATVPMAQKIMALNKAGPMSTQPKKLESMSPREALKVPYDADDKKRTLVDSS